MTTENQGQHPLSPNPASSLPQQEKRWTVSDEDSYGQSILHFSNTLVRLETLLATKLRDAHNATLSEPKEREYRRALTESNGVLKVLVNWSDLPETQKETICEVIDRNTAALSEPKESEEKHD